MRIFGSAITYLRVGTVRNGKAAMLVILITAFTARAVSTLSAGPSGLLRRPLPAPKRTTKAAV